MCGQSRRMSGGMVKCHRQDRYSEKSALPPRRRSSRVDPPPLLIVPSSVDMHPASVIEHDADIYPANRALSLCCRRTLLAGLLSGPVRSLARSRMLPVRVVSLSLL